MPMHLNFRRNAGQGKTWPTARLSPRSLRRVALFSSAAMLLVMAGIFAWHATGWTPALAADDVRGAAAKPPAATPGGSPTQPIAPAASDAPAAPAADPAASSPAGLPQGLAGAANDAHPQGAPHQSAVQQPAQAQPGQAQPAQPHGAPLSPGQMLQASMNDSELTDRTLSIEKAQADILEIRSKKLNSQVQIAKALKELQQLDPGAIGPGQPAPQPQQAAPQQVAALAPPGPVSAPSAPQPQQAAPAAVPKAPQTEPAKKEHRLTIVDISGPTGELVATIKLDGGRPYKRVVRDTVPGYGKISRVERDAILFETGDRVDWEDRAPPVAGIYAQTPNLPAPQLPNQPQGPGSVIHLPDGRDIFVPNAGQLAPPPLPVNQQ